MDCTRRAAGVARSFPGWLQDHGVAASGWRQTFAQQAVTSASADGRGESLCHHREDESGAVEHDTLSSRHNEPGMRRSSSRRIDASPRNLQQQHFSSPSQRGSGSSLGGLQLGEFARHSIHVRHSQSWGHRLWSTQWGESMLRSDQRCSALGGVALAHSKAGAGPATELASSPDQVSLQRRFLQNSANTRRSHVAGT